jgi:hypothetical protein
MKAAAAMVVLLASLGACGRQGLWDAPAMSGAVAGGGGGTVETGGASGGAGSTGFGGRPMPMAFDDGFDVGTVPGLEVWVDAGRGVTTDPMNQGRIVQWSDQSGASNNFGGIPPASYSAAAQGRPAEVVVSAGDTLETDGDVGFGTGNFLAYVVASWSGGTPFARGLIATEDMLGNPGNSLVLAPESTGDVKLTVSGGIEMTSHRRFDDGTLHVIGVVRAGTGNATSLALRGDGTAESVTTGSGLVVDLGGRLTAIKLGPEVAIAEVVVARGAPIADADVTRLEAHLLSKYGLR